MVKVPINLSTEELRGFRVFDANDLCEYGCTISEAERAWMQEEAGVLDFRQALCQDCCELELYGRHWSSTAPKAA